MRISVSWLRALVPGLATAGAGGGELDAQAIADRLTKAGLEVEGMIHFGAGIEPVVIAKVVSIKPHPTKSGLRLVTVDRGATSRVGSSNDTLQNKGETTTQEVVCGAPNVPEPGGLVVLAPLGAHLPAAAGGKGMTIARRAIGGVESDGMLCSERELGIAWGEVRESKAGGGDKADEHADDPRGDGILVLPAGTGEPGTLLRTAVPAVFDQVLEIGVTANRPDALGHVGVARELAALLELPFGVPEPTAPNRILQAKVEAMARVSIAPNAQERCSQYTGVVAVDLTVAPSPLWMRYRLHALGVRSISNLVDVTNLVMLEYGQPLHAFDLDRLDGAAIHVRLARKDEPLITLDGVRHTLTEDDLVVCDGGPDGGKPVALAGVMGGGNSEISASTKRVLLECAYFEPRGVRRSARRHGLHTEASHRFERGVDPGAIADVAAQAAAMMVRLGHGAAVSGMLNALGKTFEPTKLTLRHARIEHLLGVDVPEDEAAAVLDRLGCEVSSWVEGVLTVTVPTHRPDLQREVDLIEEIARVRGYDRIPSEVPAVRPQAPRTTGVVERRARHLAREIGLSEAIHYAFTSPRELEAVSAPPVAIRLKNPLGEERSVMRTSLLPGLLGSLARARRRGERRVRLFEVGVRFLEGGPEASLGLCDEVSSFAAVLAGPRDAFIGRGEEVDVYDAKGVAVALVERLTHQTPTVALLTKDRPAHLHPRGAGEVRVGERIVGHFGPLHPDVVDRLELDGGAMIVELDLRALEALGLRTPQYHPLPTLPATIRDVALVVKEAITAGQLADALRSGAGEMCESVEIFDLYRGTGVAEGDKSLAFRLIYRDPKMTRTLTDAEVDAQHGKAVAAAQSLGATPRA